MSDNPSRPESDEDDDLLAAEYALNLLDRGERRRVRRRLDREPALERRVERWDERLSPLLEPVQPVGVPTDAWSDIERALERAERHPGRALVPSPVAAVERLVSPLWKWFGLGASGLLAASLALLFVATQPRVGEPAMAAVIAPEGGVALYAAVIDGQGRRATLVPVAAPELTDRVRELWMIAPGAEPRSLGLLPAGGAVEIALPMEPAPSGMTLAISVEPPGGSPTGRPTGPVVGAGALRRV